MPHKFQLLKTLKTRKCARKVSSTKKISGMNCTFSKEQGKIPWKRPGSAKHAVSNKTRDKTTKTMDDLTVEHFKTNL